MRLGVAVLLMMCVVSACRNSERPPESAVDAALLAPDFTLTGLDGTSYTLSTLRGQWVILNFWATWCVPCIAEMPVLQATADTYRGQITMLGINVRESRGDVAAFAGLHDLHFPLLIDADDATLLNYQVVGVPQTVVVSPTGEIVDRRFGPLELQAFSHDIARLLTGTD